MGITQKIRHISAITAVSLLLFTLIPAPLGIAAVTDGGGGGPADPPYTQNTSAKLEDQIKVHQRYLWLRSCFQYVGIDKTTASDMESWDFFQDSGGGLNQIVGNIYGAGADAVVSCESEESIRAAFGLLEFDTSKPREVFCNLEGAYNGDRKGDKEYCLLAPDGKDWQVDDLYDWKGNYDLDKFRKSFEKMADAKSPGAKSFSGAEEYLRAYLSFNEQCNPTYKGNYPTTGDPADGDTNQYKIPVIYKDGAKFKIGYLLAYGKTDHTPLALEETIGDSADYKDGGQNAEGIVMDCGEAAKGMRGNAEAYRKYLEDHPNEAKETNPTTAGAGEKTCESEGGPLGWILCSALRLVDGMLSSLDEGISGLLFVDHSYYSTANLGSSWKAMRNIAYLILIPMMLVMVIGTAIGVGPFDAYTVKKSLPRMLAATMFISLSLPITQLGVQVSNSVGNGVGNFITSTVPKDKQINSLQDIFAKNESTTGDSVATGFTGLVILGAGLTVGLTLFSFAAVAAVGLLIGFAVLVMRQVLIVTLIVVAPIAILVWIFPGNDKIWIMWKTTFIAMLMMYPLISILIASGKFVAGIAG